MLGHWAGKWQVAIQPTAYKPGIQHKLCKRCGQVVEQRVLRYPLAHFAVPAGPADLSLQRFLPDLDARELFVVQVSLAPDSVTGIPLISPDGYYIGTLQLSLPQGKAQAEVQLHAANSHLIDLRARLFASWQDITPARIKRLTKLMAKPNLSRPRNAQDQALLVFSARVVFDSGQADNQRLTPAQAAALAKHLSPAIPPALANVGSNGQ